MSASNPEWTQLIDSTNTSLPFPEARFTVAGGVYPGSDQLWISMGDNISGRKLSDTWILQVNTSGSSLSGESHIMCNGPCTIDFYPPSPPLHPDKGHELNVTVTLLALSKSEHTVHTAPQWLTNGVN